MAVGIKAAARRVFRSSPPQFEGVGVYEVDTAANLRRRSLAYDGLDIDHQPSHASNLVRAEAEKGSPLTPAEIREVWNQGTAVTVPEGWHRGESRTYGGRNSLRQIAADAADPVSGALADSRKMFEGASLDLEALARNAVEEIRRRSRGE